MRTARPLLAVLLVVLATLPPATAAAVGPAPLPAAAASQALPPGSENALALLAAFAAGRTATPLEQAYGRALVRVPGARANALRIVERFRRLPAAEQARLFHGKTVDFVRSPTVADLVKGTPIALPTTPPPVDTLPPEASHYGPEHASTLEYSGLWCRKTADSDADGDEIQVYVDLVVPSAAGYDSSASLSVLPDGSSVKGIKAGSASNAGQGLVWTGATWPAAAPNKTGPILVTALLEDDGDAAAEKQRVQLLIEASKVYAATLPGKDTMASLQTALEYNLAMLRIDDPARWTANAVVIHPISGADYDALWKMVPNAWGNVPWKLRIGHDTHGSDYSLLFTTPTAARTDPYANVKVSLDKVEAIGTVKDTENGLADFAATVWIKDASSSREFQKDANVVAPGWGVQRTMFPGLVAIRIRVDEMDAAPSRRGSTSPGPLHEWCGDDPSSPPPGYASGVYDGPCKPIANVCDISPDPNTCGMAFGSTDASCGMPLDVVYDVAKGEVRDPSGVVLARKGQSILSEGTGERAARVTFRVE
jgi:hypothetical protein